MHQIKTKAKKKEPQFIVIDYSLYHGSNKFYYNNTI
jgi:hypothetical protein